MVRSQHLSLRRTKIAAGNAQNMMTYCCCAGLSGSGSNIQIQGKPMSGIEDTRLPAFLSGGLRVDRLQPLTTRGCGNTACQFLLIAKQSNRNQQRLALSGSVGNLLKSASATLVTVDTGMGENEVRRVRAVCDNRIQHRLPYSAGVLPDSLRKRCRTVVIEQAEYRIIEPMIIDDLCREERTQFCRDSQFPHAGEACQQNENAHESVSFPVAR